MFIVVAAIFILIFTMFKTVMEEMERRDAMLRNATLSNATLFLSSDFDDAWLTVRVLENVTAAENMTAGDTQKTLLKAKIEPEWSLIRGTFKHVKDENFENFLVMAGVPYLVRSFIVRTTPTIHIQYAYEGDDDYNDLEDHTLAEDYEVGEGRVFQMIITTTTWIKTSVERFRPGFTFMKFDYDGTQSTNTYRFLSPTVLVHEKEKERYSTNIVRSFDQDGFVLTIIDKKTGVWAKRYYKREGEVRA
ncbi:uncharacterized protein [Panulirus ornatus]|uniref:uncharacterized protein isoform X2 n=1 Tax=Panulirus ornatus TaxID=150431 RepID=UPI003A85B375